MTLARISSKIKEVGKTVRKFFVLVLLVFVSTSNVLAYDFLGLNPKLEEYVEGSPENINWDPKFLAEIEALQASILRQISTYENYMIDRRVIGVEVVVDNSWWGRLFKQKKNFFALSDQLMPKSNKCSSSDANRHAIMSEITDITNQTKEIRNGREVSVWHEYTAIVSGEGWQCEGRSGEAFWADETDPETGEVTTKEAFMRLYSVDDAYIDEYKRRTKDIKHPGFDPDATEDFLFDAANGKYFTQLQKARDYVTENCVCKLKEQEEEKK